PQFHQIQHHIHHVDENFVDEQHFHKYHINKQHFERNYFHHVEQYLIDEHLVDQQHFQHDIINKHFGKQHFEHKVHHNIYHDSAALLSSRMTLKRSVKDLIFQIEERQKLGRAQEARQAALLAQQEAQRRRRQRPAVQQAPQAPPSGSILSAPFPMLLGRETQQPTKVLIEAFPRRDDSPPRSSGARMRAAAQAQLAKSQAQRVGFHLRSERRRLQETFQGEAPL
ncbi:unnamed protein product, partial [Symbiodinium necroappetens]